AATGLPRNLVTKREYRGMNVLLLSLGQPYTSPFWLSFKQAMDLGGHVRKGEKGSLVTFWKFQREVKPEEGAEAEADTAPARRSVLLRHFTVFNVEQCEGIDAPPVAGFVPQPQERMARCEAVVAGMPSPPAIERHPQLAGYSALLDVVALPDI